MIEINLNDTMTKQMFLFPQDEARELVLAPESPVQIPDATDVQPPKNLPEGWNNSIPAQVFLNHFFGIHYHIEHSGEAYSMYNLPYFLNHHPTMTKDQVEYAKKMLVNSWSTEYALRTTAELGDEQYLRNALHWTFPQAYYSILFSIRAFLATHDVTGINEELIRREISRLVVKGFYPLPVAFYAAGAFGETSILKLPLADYKAGLRLPAKGAEAQAHIAQFLRTSRNIRAKKVKQQVQNNPQYALRSPRTGEILQKFSKKNWREITWRIGYTTYFDLISRLKISANYREIERFTEADIDFKLFHKSLADIVAYLNFIHESYIAKAMGLEKYSEFVYDLPKHLKISFVQERLENKIKPILHRSGENQLKTAA